MGENISQVLAANLDKMPKMESEGIIRIQWSIQVINKNGTKSAPHILTNFVKGPVFELGDSCAIQVTAKDALGTVAIAEVDVGVKILGDVLADWWRDHKKEYEQYIPVEELLPSPPSEEQVLVMSKGLPLASMDMQFRRPELAFNIPNAKLLRRKG